MKLELFPEKGNKEFTISSLLFNKWCSEGFIKDGYEEITLTFVSNQFFVTKESKDRIIKRSENFPWWLDIRSI